MPRKCYDVIRRHGDRLELKPTKATFREMWKGASKGAVFAQEDDFYAPEVRYEVFSVVGLESPSYQEFKKLKLICPVCGEQMKCVAVPTMSSLAMVDFGEWRCQACYQKAWDAERYRRDCILDLREYEGRLTMK